MAKPASISPFVRASHAPVALCVNIRVITPSDLRTRRHSAKDGCHPFLVVPSRERAGAFFPPKLGRICDGFVVLVRQVSAEELGEDVSGGAL